MDPPLGRQRQVACDLLSREAGGMFYYTHWRQDLPARCAWSLNVIVDEEAATVDGCSGGQEAVAVGLTVLAE